MGHVGKAAEHPSGPAAEEWQQLIETPGGWVIAAGRGESLQQLSFPYTDRASAGWIADAEHSGVRDGGPELFIQRLTMYLEDYFSGKAPVGEVAISLDSLPDFTRRVLVETARVPWGTTCSYGDLADRIGSPRAARAVGQALGRNPIPIVVPCHRVLAGDGRIGGFGGGLCMKRRLLKLEGVEGI